MTNHSATADRLQPLLSAMLDGQLTGGQITKLRRLLRTDPAARRQYVRQVNAHVMLQWMNAPPDADGGQPASSIPPIILNLSPNLHSPLFTLRSPVGGLLFSYSMASLSLALVLLVAWTWKISVDREIPQVVLSQAVPGANSESPIPTVGRITGVVECRWADSENQPSTGILFRWAENSPWLRDSWKSPTTRGRRSSFTDHVGTRPNRPAAASSRWAG